MKSGLPEQEIISLMMLYLLQEKRSSIIVHNKFKGSLMMTNALCSRGHNGT
jgi:hypothetical protein